MAIIKSWFFILILIILFGGLLGCNAVKEKEILNIRLECADLCKQMEKPPFTEKTFEDTDEIKTFVKAINKAKKMNGELDYGVLFLMHISFKDGSQKKYVLNITKEEGGTGLLVDTADSGQGYEIPEGLHNELSKIIYTS
ncbi:hypothetical protein [Paenibacillus prosopidis]|uniref:YhfM-like domain-containing protein n=1 Tax=Paenibacillus prosopidis TaxID=630520 RepID=A0A368W1D8_9BACL|nr:hypothetical protein [Paenibacillus prosopidis]RCW46458.1 hypothetical protein DFP97_109101 [Paenibacillus prosopidis]